MITKIEANKRHLAFHGWLKSFHLFSFADYFDPENVNFGSLRVFNDDWIDAQAGFGDHQHENMEIVTIVLEGELSHKDSMGNKGSINAGEVQYMSAGTTVIHSEMNLSDKPAKLYQIWIQPRLMEVTPEYSQKDFSTISKKNILLPVASGRDNGEALVINADATIALSELEAEKSIKMSVGVEYGVFVYLSKGALDINGVRFDAFDQARINGEDNIAITAITNAAFVLIVVPMTE